jgi:hypothetical protein
VAAARARAPPTQRGGAAAVHVRFGSSLLPPALHVPTLSHHLARRRDLRPLHVLWHGVAAPASHAPWLVLWARQRRHVQSRPWRNPREEKREKAWKVRATAASLPRAL